MEDLPVKAIVIGVSVFVTMAVLSAILIYFNTAREIADKVSNRVDIADSYDAIMNDRSYEDTLTGVEVRSLIIKYAGSDIVTINILENEEIKYANVNNEWYAEVNSTTKAELISEAKLDLINPACRYDIKKEKNVEHVTLNISLIVEE